MTAWRELSDLAMGGTRPAHYTRLCSLFLSDTAKQAAGVYSFPAITGGFEVPSCILACRMTTRFIMSEL